MNAVFFLTATRLAPAARIRVSPSPAILLMIDMSSFFFLLLLGLTRHGQTHSEQSLFLFTGLERPPRFPWQQSGVAPAHSGVLPASKSIAASCATSTLPTTSRHHWGDANRDGTGDVCLSRIRHPVDSLQRAVNRATALEMY
jgi:hypothetical protein